MSSLPIQSSSGVYTVHFIETVQSVLNGCPRDRQILVVIDRNVSERFGQELLSLFEGMPTHVFAATESSKTLDGCAEVLAFMQDQRASRRTHLVAIGGGIIQDVVTLCACLYFRGISWHYVPTTLLGMADSCIGAKASINFRSFKNQLGVFHSPASVTICPRFTQTLPDVEIRSGWGEIVKLHLIGGRDDFAAARETLKNEGFRGGDLLTRIRRSLEIKKSVIEIDEFDVGIRRNLNYGHTFGHALEAITHHAVPHGIAIVWGMDLINHLARKRGWLSQSDFDAIHSVLASHFSFTIDQTIDTKALIDATRRDKKNADGKLQLAILREPGRAEIIPQPYDDALVADVEEYMARFSIITTR